MKKPWVPAGGSKAARPNRIAARTVRGFTLVELVSVLVIAAILAAMAIPRLPNSADAGARRAADALVAAFQYAQAAAEEQDAATEVAVSSSGVSVLRGGTPLPAPNGPYAVAFGPGVAVSPAGSVVFGANGLPAISRTVSYTVTGGDASFAVVLEPTGYAHE